MNDLESKQAFFAASPQAVVGASRNREKYGNKVLRAYLQQDRIVYPVNPHAAVVEGLRCYPDLASLPEPVKGICIITPPQVTESIIEQAIRLGIAHVWLQPGAESKRAVDLAKQANMNLIWGGPCVLVALGYRE